MSPSISMEWYKMMARPTPQEMWGLTSSSPPSLGDI